ncbi:hypothetical protein LCGC14_0375990 [marine sediment metagenome]|uniref:Uncharacterized protein n=1 Tax=marine sediment metagenome TaxID=412755 RepID=A0A0F9VR04_9ZZZZ
MSRLKCRTLGNGESFVLGFAVSHYLGCCDCELTHKFTIEPNDKDSVRITMWRDKGKTAQRRRRKKETK